MLLLYFSPFSLNTVLQFDKAHRLINGKSPVQERIDQEVFVLMHLVQPPIALVWEQQDEIELARTAHKWQFQPAGGCYTSSALGVVERLGRALRASGWPDAKLQ